MVSSPILACSSWRRRSESAEPEWPLALRELGGVLQQLALPTRNLIRMNVVLLSKFSQGLVAPQRLKRYFGLEQGNGSDGGVVSWSLLLSMVRIEQFIHLCLCPENRGHLYTLGSCGGDNSLGDDVRLMVNPRTLHDRRSQPTAMPTPLIHSRTHFPAGFCIPQNNRVPGGRESHGLAAACQRRWRAVESGRVGRLWRAAKLDAVGRLKTLLS